MLHQYIVHFMRPSNTLILQLRNEGRIKVIPYNDECQIVPFLKISADLSNKSFKNSSKLLLYRQLSGKLNVVPCSVCIHVVRATRTKFTQNVNKFRNYACMCMCTFVHCYSCGLRKPLSEHVTETRKPRETPQQVARHTYHPRYNANNCGKSQQATSEANPNHSLYTTCVDLTPSLQAPCLVKCASYSRVSDKFKLMASDMLLWKRIYSYTWSEDISQNVPSSNRKKISSTAQEK